MHVSGAPLVLFSYLQCVGCGAKPSRIKATLPLEKGYGVPYHREIATFNEILKTSSEHFKICKNTAY